MPSVPSGSTVWLAGSQSSRSVLSLGADDIPAEARNLLLSAVDSSILCSSTEAWACIYVTDIVRRNIWVEACNRWGAVRPFTLPMLQQQLDQTISISEQSVSVGMWRPSTLTMLQKCWSMELHQSMLASGRRLWNRLHEHPDAILLVCRVTPGMSGWQSIVALNSVANTKDIR